MLCLFPSVTLESLSNLWITLTVCLTAHSQIHTNLCALTIKVGSKIFDNLRVTTLCNTNHVLLNKVNLV